MRALRESLRGEPISRVMGIVNGTTNYILTKMTEQRMPYEAALAEAQRLGLRRAGPDRRCRGLRCGGQGGDHGDDRLGHQDRRRSGVPRGDQQPVAGRHRRRPPSRLRRQVARRHRRRSRHSGEIGVRVHPAMVPEHHPLASVRDSFNAVFVEGDAVGSLMFYGRGAGGVRRRAPCSATSSTPPSISPRAPTDRSDRSAAHGSARSTS